jgi:phosphoglycerate dehydrogenase-like enzyme
MTRVAVLDDYQGRAHELADWSSLGPAVEVTYFHRPMAGEELALALSGFEVLVLMRERTALPRGLLERLPDLRLVVTTGMGNRSVDMAYLGERGVVVSGTQGGGASTIEVTWALILSVLKRVTIEDRAMREGSWQLALPADLYDTTLGLAGLGRLGSAMVPVAKAFGMEVIAWSEHLTEERARQAGAHLVSKEELLRQSDVLSIHLVLSERTRGLFGAGDLALMKPTAVLVNTSRGPIVDEVALVDALKSGQIAAAGLDVFDREPIPPDHPLLSLENAVLTPHLGYVTERGFRAMYGQAVEDIAAFLRGKPVRVIE